MPDISGHDDYCGLSWDMRAGEPEVRLSVIAEQDIVGVTSG